MADKNISLHVDLTKPRWSQETYVGRAKHFFTVTNPLNVLLTSKDLEEARSLFLKATNKEQLPSNITENDLWKAKYRYESAYHPDTKEKMFILGRMSAQVPMNMTITGCMMTFYRTTPAVIFWQWLNQSFNAVVNYTNRSGDAPISTHSDLPEELLRTLAHINVSLMSLDNDRLIDRRLLTSYTLATTGAVTTALYLNSLTKKLPSIVGRYVPFAAVAAANCINIPLMRSREISDGIPVTTASGEKVGDSKSAAKKAIFQVITSRIGMALPGMAIPPLFMNRLAKGKLLKTYPWANAPIQVCLVGLSLVFATPLCCALFPQRSSISVSKLEDEIQQNIRERGLDIDRVYFNKGL